jgi:hypothetical protein
MTATTAATKAQATEPAPEAEAVEFLAVAYAPELREPMLQEIMGGSFGISFPATDERLVLHPGTNKVNARIWALARQTSAVQELAANGVIEEIELGGNPESDPSNPSLFSIKKVPDRSAMRLVHYSRSIPQLETWHDADDRMTIRSAIMRRIEALKEGSEV